MADKAIFDYGFELLEKRYPKEVLHEDIKALYLQHFMENLTANEFLEAVKHIVLHSRFMPTAGDLVEYIHGGREAKAIQEWQVIFDASKGDLSQSIPYLSDRARVALQAIGGLRAVGLADQRERQQLEKSFITVYCQCSSKDSNALPQASPEASTSVSKAPVEPSPMPEEVKRQLEALGMKKAMNGNGRKVNS